MNIALLVIKGKLNTSIFAYSYKLKNSEKAQQQNFVCDTESNGPTVRDSTQQPLGY